MPAPRRSRRKRPQEEQWDADGPWPLLREQQRLQALWEPSERAAAAHRAQLLVEQGYEPLLPWLKAPPAPAEQGRQLELSSPFDVEAG